MKYEKKILKRLMISKNQEFLIERLRKEWEELEKEEYRHRRRERLIATTKDTSIIVGKTLLILAALGGVALVGMKLL